MGSGVPVLLGGTVFEGEKTSRKKQGDLRLHAGAPGGMEAAGAGQSRQHAGRAPPDRLVIAAAMRSRLGEGLDGKLLTMFNVGTRGVNSLC